MIHHSKSLQRLKAVTEKIIGLPTLPTIVAKMLTLVDNPRTSASSLSRLISTDQSLTARILKIANSAYYGYPRQIATVNTAIVVMGFNAVKEMGLSLSVFDMFADLSSVAHFDITQYWRHSIGCGIASKLIARRYYTDKHGEAFVAGLLHDIGKVIVNRYMHDEFVEIITTVAKDNDSYDDVEIKILGTHHGQIGSWLAEKWLLPVFISQAIQYHHFPWLAEKNQISVAIVSLADYLCHISNAGASGRINPLEIDEKTWNIFRENNISIDVEAIKNMQNEFYLELDKNDTVQSLIL